MPAGALRFRSQVANAPRSASQSVKTEAREPDVESAAASDDSDVTEATSVAALMQWTASEWMRRANGSGDAGALALKSETGPSDVVSTSNQTSDAPPVETPSVAPGAEVDAPAVDEPAVDEPAAGEADAEAPVYLYEAPGAGASADADPTALMMIDVTVGGADAQAIIAMYGQGEIDTTSEMAQALIARYGARRYGAITRYGMAMDHLMRRAEQSSDKAFNDYKNGAGMAFLRSLAQDGQPAVEGEGPDRGLSGAGCTGQ